MSEITICKLRVELEVRLALAAEVHAWNMSSIPLGVFSV